MTLISWLIVMLYGASLRLYPREFQREFRREMQGVFASALNGAARAGTLALLQLLFFEMLDFPFNLAIEHYSQWRKEWAMKDMHHGIRPFRSAAMGALGLFIGALIVVLGAKYLVAPSWWYRVDFGMRLNALHDMIPSALRDALASALLGLMLCLSVSTSSRTTLRVCSLVAGLAVVASLIGAVIFRFTAFQRFLNQFYEGNWQVTAVALGSAFYAMIDGVFTGAGLGLGAEGWKSCWRFALRGMVAYGLGFAIGMTILQLWISSGWWIGNTTYPMAVIAYGICGLLSGGILGWFWGKETAYDRYDLLKAAA